MERGGSLIDQALGKLNARLLTHYVDIVAGKLIYMLCYLIEPQAERGGDLELELREAVGMLKHFREQAAAQQLEVLLTIKQRMGLFFSASEIARVLEQLE